MKLLPCVGRLEVKQGEEMGEQQVEKSLDVCHTCFIRNASILGIMNLTLLRAMSKSFYFLQHLGKHSSPLLFILFNGGLSFWNSQSFLERLSVFYLLFL